MKNFLLALLAFLLWAALALLFHQYASNSICGDCHTAHNEATTEPKPTEEKVVESPLEKEPTKAAFSIMAADGSAAFTFPEGFIINSKNGEVVTPEALNGFKDSIYNFLNANQGKELLISAKYLASETGNDNRSLGMTRAEFLKSILAKSGINPDKIVSQGVLSEFSYDENGNYYDGISMRFQNSSQERTAEIEEGIANKTLYSDFAQEEFKPDRTLRAYTLELKNYLAKYPDKKVYVEGHTDSIGNNNYAFGLARAENVKQYLVSQGINPGIIVTSSKGETAPVASNATEEGKAKNRRIEITIK